MIKRKPATASRHARSPRIIAKSNRAAQAIVKRPKDSVLRSDGAGSTERPPKRHQLSQDALPVENPELLVENSLTALRGDLEQVTENNSNRGTTFSLAKTNVRAYQAKLLEMTQANMQFAFEFAQRLATIKSPIEFPGVIAEFTSKRVAMFQEHSKEIAELSTHRWMS
jgi:hypothetical protein